MRTPPSMQSETCKITIIFSLLFIIVCDNSIMLRGRGKGLAVKTFHKFKILSQFALLHYPRQAFSFLINRETGGRAEFP